jgi:hypothetical protein
MLLAFSRCVLLVIGIQTPKVNFLAQEKVRGRAERESEKDDQTKPDSGSRCFCAYFSSNFYQKLRYFGVYRLTF